MAKASRKISHIQEQMEQNAIYDSWTQNWGIRVYPAYGIDKLKFSFIEKGAQGKGKSFDIYVECLRDGAQCFDNWAYDILHGRLERALAAEKQAGEKYPKRYKYTTGESAEKSIGIMNSTNGGYCINASVPGADNKKVFCNIPISFHDLRHIAERYLVSYQPRKNELEQIRARAAQEQAKWNKETSEEATVDSKPQTTTVASNAGSNEAAKATNSSQAARPDKVVPITNKFKVKATAPLADGAEGWRYLKVLDANGKERTVWFGPKAVNKTGERWTQFVNLLKARPNTEFTISAIEKEDKLQFASF